MIRFNKGFFAAGNIANRSLEHGSAMLELVIVFSVVMLLVFIPLTTQVLPQYQKGNIVINLYESYSAYTVPDNHFTNLDATGYLVPADTASVVDPGLQAIAADLVTLTGVNDFCGVLMQFSIAGGIVLITSQNDQSTACPGLQSIADVPGDIVQNFSSTVTPSDGATYGATIYHQDPITGALTYAPLRLSAGVLNE